MRKLLNFLGNLGINLLLNLWGIIPAAILFILHFIFPVSLKWALFALLIWIGYIAIRLVVITFFVSLPTPTKEEEYRENKNPYYKK